MDLLQSFVLAIEWCTNRFIRFIALKIRESFLRSALLLRSSLRIFFPLAGGFVGGGSGFGVTTDPDEPMPAPVLLPAVVLLPALVLLPVPVLLPAVAGPVGLTVCVVGPVGTGVGFVPGGVVGPVGCGVTLMGGCTGGVGPVGGVTVGGRNGLGAAGVFGCVGVVVG